MSNSITLPASLQPPSPPPNVMDTTPGANPTEPVAHYKLSSGYVATLPQSSVPELMKQDSGAKQIPSPANGEVLVQLSERGSTATLPVTSLPALKQQYPNYKYIAGDTTTPKQFTPGFDALSAVTGPGTALGTPVSPAVSQEASGASDILHGNVRQGAGKILAAEAPHVVQGSWLEKAIQKVDPSFQGSVTDSQVKAYQDTYDALGHPLVDVASGIDKQQHPIGKAIAEAGQSLLTPSTIATMYATGGLGLVESPAALGMANKLISSGFSAAAIARAYTNLKGFKKAYDAGDSTEAAYQLTHAVTSGTLGLLAAKDAAPAMTSAVRDIMNPFIKGAATAARAVGESVSMPQAIRPTAEVAGETFNTRPITNRFGVRANEAAGADAVRSVAQGASDAAGGLPVSQASSLRDIWEEPINAKTAEAKTYYKQLDDASNNAWTANDNALNNVRRDIRMKGGIDDELDAKLEARKTALEAQQNEILAKLPEGTAAQARSLWEAKSRLEDLQDIFQKKSNVSGTRPEMVTPGVKLPPEQYNFKNIAKDLNAMDPDDLTKAVGSKEAAQDLVATVNLAAKQAWTSSKTAKTIFGLLKTAGVIAGTGEVVKNFME